MRKAILGVRIVVVFLVLWATGGATLAADVNLTNSVVGFHAPIGIDFQDTSGKLILSVNYPTGAGNNRGRQRHVLSADVIHPSNSPGRVLYSSCTQA